MILQMRDICKDYPMGKTVTHVLKNVDLDVSEGDYLAIMGPSGSGKTTLMNLIGCLDVPTSGSYLLGDREITKCSGKELAVVRNREIGFVFQSFHLLPKLTARRRRNGVSVPVPRWKRWALPTGSTTGPTSCPADSASVWPSPAPSWASPGCCWPTSLPARWTAPAAHR